MGIYEELQPVASELLKEFNQGVIRYVRLVPGNGPRTDPGPPSYVPVTLLGATSRGVSFMYMQKSLAVAGDKQVTTSGALPPELIVSDDPPENIKDFIDIDGVRHKIVRIIRKPDAGTVVAYTFIVRK